MNISDGFQLGAGEWLFNAMIFGVFVFVGLLIGVVRITYNAMKKKRERKERFARHKERLARGKYWCINCNYYFDDNRCPKCGREGERRNEKD